MGLFVLRVLTEMPVPMTRLFAASLIQPDNLIHRVFFFPLQIGYTSFCSTVADNLGHPPKDYVLVVVGSFLQIQVVWISFAVHKFNSH